MSASALPRPATGVSPFTDLRRATAAEWTRLWSVRSTWWSLAGAAAMMLFIGFAFGQDVSGEVPFWVPGEIAFAPAQLVLYVLVMLPVTSEYATGAIRSSLQAVPRRGVLLLARTLVVLTVAVVAAVVLALAASGMAAIGLGDRSLFDGAEVVESLAMVAVVVGTGSLLTVGFGSFLRSSAGTLMTVFLLLLVLPQLLPSFGIGWLTAIGEHLPGYAQLSMLGAFGGLPISSARATVILAVWVLAALTAGAWSLLRRDAT